MEKTNVLYIDSKIITLMIFIKCVIDSYLIIINDIIPIDKLRLIVAIELIYWNAEIIYK